MKNVLAPKKSFSEADFYERDRFSHHLERVKYCILELRHCHKIENKYLSNFRCSAQYWEGKGKNWFYLDLETQAGTYVKVRIFY